MTGAGGQIVGMAGDTEDVLVVRLAALDTPAVSDALDREGSDGVLLGLAAVSAARRIAGRAVTVLLGPDDGRPRDRHLCAAAVDAAGPGQVLVIAHHGRTEVAGWGGLLSQAAVARRVEGVVIDGACRDVDESRELGLPVYARAGVPVSARGRIVEVDWNVPVPMAGITVAPGDLVLADGSGVVAIAAADAEAIIGRAGQIAARERAMAAAIREGTPVSEVMGRGYETMTVRGKTQ